MDQTDAGDSERAEPSTSHVELGDDGIVRVRVLPGMRQTVGNARANLVAAMEARGGRTRPILVDIKGCVPLDAEVRSVYMGKAVMSSFAAIALVVDGTGLGRLIGNLYLRVASLGIPARIFWVHEEATDWLRLFVPAARFSEFP